jgi:uncharacterized protein (TIGR00299 family) protein
VHFHEVGTLDAVADIVGVCRLFEILAPENVAVSPINVGSGQVRCAHGILPVPAPATANILTKVPAYSNSIKGELCTPTGAALLRYFATQYGNMPIMTTEKIGYGMGNKDFEAANCVRVFMGEIGGNTGEITEISCNIDDMTGEELGFALGTLMENGALDVCIIPAQMKKSRPGHILLCLCKTTDEEKFAKLILKYTSTFGVRIKHCKRYILHRQTETLKTDHGDVRVIIGSGYGITKRKFEYDDLAAMARERGMSISDAATILD